MVLIDPDFLNTLEKRELTSGLAEIIKYGLTFDTSIWADFKNPQGVDLLKLIYQSIAIKNDVVKKDPKEQDVRKALNYGHTLGHAIESFYLSSPRHSKMTHGEAIAIGMIAEAHLSFQMGYLREDQVLEIKEVILNVFDHQIINSSDNHDIYEYLKHDKKNISGNVNFVLLSNIGEFILNQRVTEDQMTDALDFYNLN
jgi:3-dehydroquinate synthase